MVGTPIRWDFLLGGRDQLGSLLIQEPGVELNLSTLGVLVLVALGG